jgi:hypothetical protein
MFMKQLFIILLLTFSFSCFSQKKEMIYLWPGKVPGESKGKQPPVADPAPKDDVFRYIEVTDPAIEIWPVELHYLPSGGHGYGLRPVNIAAKTWPVLAGQWLKRIIQPNN